MNNRRPSTKAPTSEDFNKTLETLTAADLSFLSHKSAPVTDPQPSADSDDSEPTPMSSTETPSNRKPQTRRPRKASAKIQNANAVSAQEDIPDTQLSTPSPSTINNVGEGQPAQADTQDASLNPEPIHPQTGAEVPAEDDGIAPDTQKRTRTTVAHEWPAVGTKLKAEYFGQTYHAEIVPAKKRLKSGKQIRLLDGPATGRRLDSFSKAMLVATARQRREMKLKHKGVSNGWSFWVRSDKQCS